MAERFFLDRLKGCSDCDDRDRPQEDQRGQDQDQDNRLPARAVPCRRLDALPHEIRPAGRACVTLRYSDKDGRYTEERREEEEVDAHRHNQVRFGQTNRQNRRKPKNKAAMTRYTPGGNSKP